MNIDNYFCKYHTLKVIGMACAVLCLIDAHAQWVVIKSLCLIITSAAGKLEAFDLIYLFFCY